MSIQAKPAAIDSALAPSRQVLEDLFAPLRPRSFDVRFWDGSIWRGDTETPRFTLVLKHPGSVRRMFWPPGPNAFDAAYVYDDFDVEGDMLGLPELCSLETVVAGWSLSKRLRLAWRLWRLPRVEPPRQGRQAAKLSGRQHSRERDLEAVRYHYDLPGEFFERVLDPYMQYTTAIFESPEESLESAQKRKLDLICRKLRLRPGARVLDIGCGWGGLAIEIAREHGAKVLGITLSKEQLVAAQQRAEAAGLSHLVEFKLIDYRDVEGPFDRIVSVGMFEHVGVPNYRAYFEAVRRLLKPDGVALIHSIGRRMGPAVTQAWIQKYIFPGGYIPALSEVTPAVEKADLWITDVEILRLHYAETLRHWRERFVSHWDEMAELYDERFCRMWEFYLAFSELAFRYMGHMVFQMQLTRKTLTLPITRDYIHDAEHAAPRPRAQIRQIQRVRGEVA